ncbi:MAG: hypothetical protein PWP24_1776 [Clostridiales bacterium]|nr:hypothetical protein [Clostridiales bacterium]
MIKIAICDDMPEQLAKMNAYIEEYMIQNGLCAEIRQFLHPDRLLCAVQEEIFQLCVLDIVMPMVNGIELGKEIRRIDREVQIIYITTEPQFALQTYVANPVNYLIKPIDKEQLFQTLTFAFLKIDRTKEVEFCVKTAQGLRVLYLSELLYLEYCNQSNNQTSKAKLL